MKFIILLLLLLSTIAYAANPEPLKNQEPEYETFSNYNPNVKYGEYYKNYKIKPVKPTPVEPANSQTVNENLNRKWYVNFSYKPSLKSRIVSLEDNINTAVFSFNSIKTDPSQGIEMGKGSWVGRAGEALDFDKSIGYFDNPPTYIQSGGPTCTSAPCDDSLTVASTKLAGNYKINNITSSIGFGYNFLSWLRMDLSLSVESTSTRINSQSNSYSGSSKYTAETDYMCNNFGKEPNSSNNSCNNTTSGIGKYYVEQTDSYSLKYNSTSISVNSRTPLALNIYFDYIFNNLKYPVGISASAGMAYEIVNIKTSNIQIAFDDSFNGKITGCGVVGGGNTGINGCIGAAGTIDNQGEETKYSGTLSQNFIYGLNSKIVNNIIPSASFGILTKINKNMFIDLIYSVSYIPTTTYKIKSVGGVKESTVKYTSKPDPTSAINSAKLNNWNTAGKGDGGTVDFAGNYYTLKLDETFNQNLILRFRYYIR